MGTKNTSQVHQIHALLLYATRDNDSDTVLLVKLVIAYIVFI